LPVRRCRDEDLNATAWPQGTLRKVVYVLDWSLVLASDLEPLTLALKDVLGFGLEFGLIFILQVKSLALHVPQLPSLYDW